MCTLVYNSIAVFDIKQIVKKAERVSKSVYIHTLLTSKDGLATLCEYDERLEQCGMAYPALQRVMKQELKGEWYFRVVGECDCGE